jgi:hypothetical protein
MNLTLVSPKPEKQLRAFCVGFPDNFPDDMKSTFIDMLNATDTVIKRVSKDIPINDWPLFCEGDIFRFSEHNETYTVYNFFRKVIDQFQDGKNPSIAYGIPDYGFDLMFVELMTIGPGQESITDAYMVQNTFVTDATHDIATGKTAVKMKGFYAENDATMALAVALMQTAPDHTIIIEESWSNQDILIP